MKLQTKIVSLFDYPIDCVRALLPPSDAPVWDVDRNRQQKYEEHVYTRSILFEWLDNAWLPGTRPEIDQYRYTSVALNDAVQEFGARLRDHFGSGRVAKLFLAELSPGGIINPHHDKAAALVASHRCHLPIVTSEGVEFYIEREPHFLKPGVAYEFDNTRTHAVRNLGPDPRVHLICDILPDELAA